jgi:hypothetical protein
MGTDTEHTLLRIDVMDRLPRDGSLVLCWGHQQDYGFRWVDVLEFSDGRFVDTGALECGADKYDWTDDVTHWASLVPLNWNGGLPFHRSCNQ